MSLLDRIASRFRFTRAFGDRASKKRSQPFHAANIDRLSADWAAKVLTGDAALRRNLRTIRARARDAERNHSVVRAFKKALARNVLGAGGIKLQMKVQNPDGSSDRNANRLIEAAWKDYSDKKLCDFQRRLSWRQMEEMVLTRAAIDGEVLSEKRIEKENAYGMSLYIHEPDLLDEDFNLFRDGKRVVMSVELDSFNRTQAYWLLSRHPGDDTIHHDPKAPVRFKLDADKAIHVFSCERPTQTRGFPWVTSALMDSKMLDGYREAALVAARTGACKSGFIKSAVPDGATYPEEDGQRQVDIEPGVIEELGMGKDFIPYDPTYPNQDFGGFVKSIMLQISSGLGVSYTTLAGDLEGVNYSSIRAGVLEEREEWKQIQEWLITEFHRPFFRAWLEMAILTKAIPLPYSKLEKFLYADTWCGRRWAWVDPEKDIRSALMQVDGGLRSRRRVIAETDAGDIEDVFAEIAEDNALAKEMGVETVGANGTPLVVGPATSGGDGESGDDEGQEGQDSSGSNGVEALNGAQVAAMQEVLQSVASGQLPAITAELMLIAAFPQMDEAKIKKMVAAAASFTPKPIEAPVAKPAAEVTKETK